MSASGIVNFAPDGTAAVTVEVRGDNLDEDVENFTVNLSGPSGATLANAQAVGSITDDDAAPVLNTEPVLTLSEDPLLPAPFTLQADDGDNDPLTFQVVTGPSHGTMTGPVGNLVQYTPAPNYNGSDSFTVQVSDGTNTTSVRTRFRSRL